MKIFDRFKKECKICSNKRKFMSVYCTEHQHSRSMKEKRMKAELDSFGILFVFSFFIITFWVAALLLHIIPVPSGFIWWGLPWLITALVGSMGFAVLTIAGVATILIQLSDDPL